jgi:MFS family permease
VSAATSKASVGILEARGPRTALTGYFLTGMLFTFLGAILPSWGYHLTELYPQVGNYFLGFNAGLFAAYRLAAKLISTKGVRWCLVLACSVACASLLALAFVLSPVLRMGALLALGFAVGLLQGAILEAITPIYRHDPAATGNLGGIYFGLGSLFMALLIAGTYYAYSVTTILVAVAVVPGCFAIWYRRMDWDVRPDVNTLRENTPPLPATANRVAIAIQCALLLFLQTANEWSIAGWLALFLTQRLGLSPSSALLFLSLYCGTLVIGRIAAQAILPFVKHGRLLFLSSVFAMFGCMVLTFTDNRFGVFSGILFLGIGFAPVYPLLAEHVNERFPSWDPSQYTGVFALAFIGALLVTGGLGYLAAWAGIKSILWVPLAGTTLVALLLTLLWVEAKLAPPGDTPAKPAIT